MIRVLIADDLDLVREGVRALLERHDDFMVVGEAATGGEAIELAGTLLPDVVLMDLAMPGMSGLEAIQVLASQQPQLPVLAFSAYADEKRIGRAVRAGARGYVLKTEGAEGLCEAIRTVVRGEAWFSTGVQSTLERTAGDPTLAALDPLERLSQRQRRVLQLIAEGHSNRTMAATLRLSESTVDSHRTELMRRLGVHDVATLVRFACQEGLVSLD